MKHIVTINFLLNFPAEDGIVPAPCGALASDIAQQGRRVGSALVLFARGGLFLI